MKYFFRLAILLSICSLTIHSPAWLDEAPPEEDSAQAEEVPPAEESTEEVVAEEPETAAPIAEPTNETVGTEEIVSIPESEPSSLPLPTKEPTDLPAIATSQEVEAPQEQAQTEEAEIPPVVLAPTTPTQATKAAASSENPTLADTSLITINYDLQKKLLYDAAAYSQKIRTLTKEIEALAKKLHTSRELLDKDLDIFHTDVNTSLGKMRSIAGRLRSYLSSQLGIPFDIKKDITQPDAVPEKNAGIEQLQVDAQAFEKELDQLKDLSDDISAQEQSFLEQLKVLDNQRGEAAAGVANTDREIGKITNAKNDSDMQTAFNHIIEFYGGVTKIKSYLETLEKSLQKQSENIKNQIGTIKEKTKRLQESANTLQTKITSLETESTPSEIKTAQNPTSDLTQKKEEIVQKIKEQNIQIEYKPEQPLAQKSVSELLQQIFYASIAIIKRGAETVSSFMYAIIDKLKPTPSSTAELVSSPPAPTLPLPTETLPDSTSPSNPATPPPSVLPSTTEPLPTQVPVQESSDVPSPPTPKPKIPPVVEKSTPTAE